MKLNLIVENKTFRENIVAEHGLALLIETEEKTILFDSGQSDALINNAKTMDLDLTKVDFAMLSHGHFDHSGGFQSFYEIAPDTKIYLHKNAFKETFDIDKNGDPTGENVGIRWSADVRNKLEPSLVFTDKPVYITENIVISGSIPKEMRETSTGQFLEKKDNHYEPDQMEHEQFLIVRENEKLYLFSGCSHNGVMSVIEYAKKLFPGYEIQLLFGGFHLYESSGEQLAAGIERIISSAVKYYMPVHCTGLDATFKLKELLDDRCIVMNAGDKLYF